MCEFLSALVGGILSPIILGIGKRMIAHPKLNLKIPAWKEQKIVIYDIDKKYGSTSLLVEMSGREERLTVFGINIANRRGKIIQSFPAIINSTKITIYNAGGDIVVDTKEARWWAHNIPSIQELFVPDNNIDLIARKSLKISDGDFAALVLYAKRQGSDSRYLFAIDSDRQEEFLNKEHKFKGEPPYYLLISIYGDNIRTNFHIKITDNDEIITINKFPFEKG